MFTPSHQRLKWENSINAPSKKCHDKKFISPLYILIIVNISLVDHSTISESGAKCESSRLRIKLTFFLWLDPPDSMLEKPYRCRGMLEMGSSSGHVCSGVYCPHFLDSKFRARACFRQRRGWSSTRTSIPVMPPFIALGPTMSFFKRAIDLMICCKSSHVPGMNFAVKY